MHKSEKVNDRKQQLIEKIAECELVVREVERSEAWKVILRDIEKTNQLINDNWFRIFDEKKLDEMRITKLAVVQLSNTIEAYKSDLAIAKQEMFAIDNPATVLNKYYDSESNTYEK